MKVIPGCLYALRFNTIQVVKISALFLFAVSVNNGLLAQTNVKAEGEFPVPSGNQNQLFYLQRTENINTVVYELNEENGNLNTVIPIRAFWIVYAKSGQRENLSGMEKEFAYGVKIKSTAKDQYQFTLAAYPKITLKLLQGADQKYHVYIKPFKQPMILSRIYIKERAGFLKMEPAVEYIEFTGTDATSGKEVSERVEP
jgi:hypothetical protein